MLRSGEAEDGASYAASVTTLTLPSGFVKSEPATMFRVLLGRTTAGLPREHSLMNSPFLIGEQVYLRPLEQAENSLRELDTPAVPLLRKELHAAASRETRRRLEAVIADLSRISWRRNLDEAIREATRTGKPILVFSTLGEVDGFA